MKVLIVATKSPWPPQDGGRLALWLTMQGLAEAGHALTLVAPVDTAAQASALLGAAELRAVCDPHLMVADRRNWATAAVRAIVEGRALTVVRHASPQVAAAVEHCVRAWRPDVVHIEQLQALANCGAAETAGVPRLLRMQNVESALWQQVAQARLRAWPLRLEAWRLRRDEVRAVGSVTRVLTLTARDAQQLRSLRRATDATAITAIPPSFPDRWPSAAPISGAPAIVLSGSGGWWPNQDGTRWFIDAVLPLLMKRLPAALVHVYGGAPITGPALRWHAAPADAIDAFPAGAIVAVPLHIGSGIRMRILEAWARGLPVTATPVAAAGLDVATGRELMIAASPASFADALVHLAEDGALCARLVAAGRAYLRQHHASADCSAALVAEYAAACGEPRPATVTTAASEERRW